MNYLLRETLQGDSVKDFIHRTINYSLRKLQIIVYGIEKFLHLYSSIQQTMLYKFLLTSILFLFTCTPKNETKAKATTKLKSEIKENHLQTMAAELKTYASKKSLNESICFLIDMKKPSGKNRFYVYDFKKNKILHQALVTHGNCGEVFLGSPKYGNAVGCNCSSLGKYKIGKKYYGKFGLAYKLHGLDKTNNKAFERFVVLHAHICVPDDEVSPMPICESNGCPTVSPGFLQTLAGFIDKSEKPVLLWMFEQH